MADGGWHSMAEVARLYGKSWKWVQNQVKQHNISTEKRGNQRVLRLVDFIAQLENHLQTAQTNQMSVIMTS